MLYIWSDELLICFSYSSFLCKFDALLIQMNLYESFYIKKTEKKPFIFYAKKKLFSIQIKIKHMILWNITRRIILSKKFNEKMKKNLLKLKKKIHIVLLYLRFFKKKRKKETVEKKKFKFHFWLLTTVTVNSRGILQIRKYFFMKNFLFIISKINYYL